MDSPLEDLAEVGRVWKLSENFLLYMMDKYGLPVGLVAFDFDRTREIAKGLGFDLRKDTSDKHRCTLYANPEDRRVPNNPVIRITLG